MAFDTAAAARMINEEIAASGGGPAAAAQALGGADFCSIWPSAKPILETISGIVSLIPGVGAAAGPVLAGLIKVGDAIFAAQCPK